MTKAQLKRRTSKLTNDFKDIMEKMNKLEERLAISRPLVIKVIPSGSTINGVLHFQEDRIFLDMAAAKAHGLLGKLTKPEQDTRACHLVEEKLCMTGNHKIARDLFSHKRFDKLLVAKKS